MTIDIEEVRRTRARGYCTNRSGRLPWARGVTNWRVSHHGYLFRQPNDRAYGHHELTRVRRKGKPGAWTCGICGRWVIRGMGRWWETWPTR